MPDQPDEVQKQPRRSTALPPFFAPRTTRPNTPVQSGTAPMPRRTSPLFTPPSVPKQQRPSTPAVAPALATSIESPAQAAPDPSALVLDTAPSDAQPVPPAPPSEASIPDGLVIERLEHPPISLRPTGEHFAAQDESTLSVFDPGRAKRDSGGFEIERTELTIEPNAGASRLEVESFWSVEPIHVSEPPPDDSPPEPLPADELDAPSDYAPAEYLAHPFAIHELPALHAPVPEPPPESAAAEVSAPEPPAADIPMDLVAPAAAAESVAAGGALPPTFEELPPSFDEALPLLEEAPPAYAWRAEVESHVDAPTAPPVLRAQPTDDAEAALEEAFAEPATPERPPRWAAPPVVDAIAVPPPAVPNAEPPAAAPRDELTDALAWPESAAIAAGSGHGEDVDVSRELSASIEGWRSTAGAGAAGGAAIPDAVAAALERIARRVRAGEVPLPGDVAMASSDESALAVALAALLRGGPRG